MTDTKHTTHDSSIATPESKTSGARKYNVRIFREMRLFYPAIEAESPSHAAAIASQKESSDAEEIEDCSGEDLSASWMSSGMTITAIAS